MTDAEIAFLRLRHQAVCPPLPVSPGTLLARLGAVQAQDYGSALWAIGLRVAGATEESIEQAIRDKQIVRTWPMRGTLHFIAAADARWLPALLAPRVIANNARRYQELELDATTFARAETVLATALQGGEQLSRRELLDALERGGISVTGQRGYHILGWAAQVGLICFGPRQGKQDSFVLLDEWLPDAKRLNREESLAEVARRYFDGHGPATLQDFIWWTGLPTADARAALAQIASQLVQEEHGGHPYWYLPSSPSVGEPAPVAFLLPAFDEYLIGYRDRTAVLDPSHATKVVPGANGIFKPLLVIQGRVVGTWARTRHRSGVRITFHPFEPPLSPNHLEAAQAAGEAYGRFLGLPVEFIP